ncbi:CPBP family intramembrane metalloprotease [Thermaerobacter sp. PB12/4term]|uniref:CPBP family glutamic-type intramembrane protease n=1 Tax=Thermaerobacter sp. PB12/4term TaxID=2293838 RepID=UPI000E3267E0|nr:CPBP family glutamic-type intramembrane protease [Thermaerobacter sp. PB12/4term]QIA27720.1 CPBP family intramembrane metalloprotease [Thermaerobacter sp. PB12/4term]
MKDLIILWLSGGNDAWWSVLVAMGNPWQVLDLGAVLALIVVGMQIAVATCLPDRLWADDGTNAFFSQLSYLHIFLLMALTALAEEIFFRAAIQSLLVEWLHSVAAGIAVPAAIFAVAQRARPASCASASRAAPATASSWG